MLCAIGGVTFDLITNPQTIEQSREKAFAAHQVVDSPIVYESVGEAEHSVTIKGVIYPMALGTTGAVTALEAIRSSGVPVPFMRGDFRPFGWCLVKSIGRSDTMLDAAGVGRKIEFTANLIWAGRPSGISAIRTIVGLFA